MAVARSRREASREDERLGLLEIARAHGIPEADATLPPGQRDGSGFWFPAGYRSPLELFTPHQRSLQAKQRLLKTRGDRTAPAPTRPAVEATALPSIVTDVAAVAAAGHASHARAADTRVRRSPDFPLVDSPGRSV